MIGPQADCEHLVYLHLLTSGEHLKTKYMQNLLLFTTYDLTTQGSEPWIFGCPENVT